MDTIYISTGSNSGDRKRMLKTAEKHISDKVGRITAVSYIYETAAQGYVAADYLNAALEVKTGLSPADVLKITQNIEKEIGRKTKTSRDKTGKAFYSPRCIDIDIIYFGQRVIETQDLTVPHPHMHTRNFVLYPLCDIAHSFLHPVLKKTNHELKEKLKQEQASEIRII